MDLEDYISAHISPEPEHLERLYRRTQVGRLYPRMCSDHAQGRLLAFLSRLTAPAAVLELGTFSGYSALCLAEGLRPGGRLDTVEIDTEYEDELRELFASSPGGEAIHLHIGDALETVPGLLDKYDYDLVFIDANKRNYPDYYNMIMPRLRSGALILADNTLWSDKILDPGATDPQTAGIRAFNDLVAADNNADKVILDTRDGLTLIRKSFA